MSFIKLRQSLLITYLLKKAILHVDQILYLASLNN